MHNVSDHSRFKESHFVQKHVNNIASVHNIAKNGYNAIDESQELADE